MDRLSITSLLHCFETIDINNDLPVYWNDDGTTRTVSINLFELKGPECYVVERNVIKSYLNDTIISAQIFSTTEGLAIEILSLINSGKNVIYK